MSDEIPDSQQSVTAVQRPLGDPEIAVEILRLRVAELEQAIRRLADQDATLSVVGGNVIVEMDAALTDEERVALGKACDLADYAGFHSTTRAVLRGLLERLGGKECIA